MAETTEETITEETVEETTSEETLTEAEILQAQLEIAVAANIGYQATIAGLEAEKAELVALISDNSTAQEVLTKAAAALSDEIDSKQLALSSSIDGLSSSEKAVLKEARQADIVELTAKLNKYKSYIRGEI